MWRCVVHEVIHNIKHDTGSHATLIQPTTKLNTTSMY